MMTAVTLTGVHDVTRNDDGSFRVVIDGRELSPTEHEVLDNLFPDLESAVGRLLAKQALLSSVR